MFLNYKFAENCLDVIYGWVRRCRSWATSRKAASSIPDGVIGIFHGHNSSVPGVDSVSNRNEYKEQFLGGKTAGTWG